MHANTEEPNTHLEVSAAPLAPNSERSSEDSEVLAMKTLFAQKAQELKAQNGEKEVFDDDHPAIKNFKRAYKARAHGVDSPSKLGTCSLPDSFVLQREALGEQLAADASQQHAVAVSTSLAHASETEESIRSSQSLVNSAKKLSRSTTASEESAGTSLLLVSPTDKLTSPVSTSAHET